MNDQTLLRYLKVLRFVQAIIWSIPLGARLISDKSAIAFPPLGPDSLTDLWMLLVITGLATLLPLLLRLSRTMTLVCASVFLIASMVSLGSFTEIQNLYVRYIRVATGKFIPVSIGSQRNPEAVKEIYGGKTVTDQTLLEDWGPSEETVQKYWTSPSVAAVRKSLLCRYALTMILLNFAIGLFARTVGSHEQLTVSATS